MTSLAERLRKLSYDDGRGSDLWWYLKPEVCAVVEAAGVVVPSSPPEAFNALEEAWVALARRMDEENL